ncbi:hypothetical protein DMJ13_25970 [halophilic archaeon]|nr:hypothetical protein DMJ13_25970 [halophilic archaeon]
MMSAGEDEGLVIAAVIGMLAVAFSGWISTILGSCPSDVSMIDQAAEGAIILAQLIGILGGLMVGVGWKLNSRTKTTYSRNRGSSYSKIVIAGVGLLTIGIVASALLNRQTDGLASCVNGLFTWLPF